jgi:hypothetical protein
LEIAQGLTKPLLPSDSADPVSRLRKWRNLVHPGRELKDIALDGIRPSKERAKIAIGVLEFVASELK